MFVHPPGKRPPRRGDTRSGEQFVHGYFLLLAMAEEAKCKQGNVYGIVTYVRLRQMGHCMNGFAFINGVKVFIEGTYGMNGLPRSVPKRVLEAGTVVPEELYDAWNKGGGHNRGGAEQYAFAEWAKTLPCGCEGRRVRKGKGEGNA